MSNFVNILAVLKLLHADIYGEVKSRIFSNLASCQREYKQSCVSDESHQH